MTTNDAAMERAREALALRMAHGFFTPQSAAECAIAAYLSSLDEQGWVLVPRDMPKLMENMGWFSGVYANMIRDAEIATASQNKERA